MKKWLLLFLAAIFAFSFTPAKAKADVFTGKGVKLYIGGQAKVRPTYYYNVDLNDDDTVYSLGSKSYKDGVIWEGG